MKFPRAMKAIVLSAVSLCALAPVLQGATSGPFTYTDTGTSITITGYQNTPGPVTIPAQIAGKPVTVIDGYAFAYRNFVTSVSIPSSVTFIGNYAFYYCSVLTSVTGGGGVTTIGDSAFGGCSSLTSFKIQSKVTYIGPRAFNLCSSLTKITIPASVSFMGDSAFENSASLNRAEFLGNAPSFGTNVFRNTAANFSVYYHQGRSGFSSPIWNGYPSAVIFLVPEIGVQQPLGSSLVDGTAKRTFGIATVGTTGSSRTFTIKNTGTGLLRGVEINKSDANAADFRVVGPAVTSLAPGTSTTFRVTFRPGGAGPRKAVLHLKSNDANESPFDISLSGSGVTP